MEVKFFAVCGDLPYMVRAKILNSGGIDVYIVKPKQDIGGKWFLNAEELGGWFFATVVDYGYSGWKVFFSQDYFVFDPTLVPTRDFKGDCLMSEDKDALLEQLIEAGLINP